MNDVNCPAEGCLHAIFPSLVHIARRKDSNSTFPFSGFLGNMGPPTCELTDQSTQGQQERFYICLEQDIDHDSFVHRQYALNRGSPPGTHCAQNHSIWHTMAEAGFDGQIPFANPMRVQAMGSLFGFTHQAHKGCFLTGLTTPLGSNIWEEKYLGI